MIKKLGKILSEKKMNDFLASTKINELLHKKDPIEEKKHTLVFRITSYNVCYTKLLRIVIFSQGTLTGVSSVPDFIAIQSSPTSIRQSAIRTFWQESGSIPSVFGESDGFFIEIPWMLTSLQ